MRPNEITMTNEDAHYQPLIEAALNARQNAYAPYSRYAVGAAVLTHDGAIFAGCNVENASYGLSICAERNAIFQAIAAGARHIQMVLVVTEDGGSPCGACRQVIQEFADDPASLMVLMMNAQGEITARSLSELLPYPFELER